VTVPASVPAGSYFLFARIDPQDRVPESSESNNQVAGFLEVTPAIVLPPGFPLR